MLSTLKQFKLVISIAHLIVRPLKTLGQTKNYIRYIKYYPFVTSTFQNTPDSAFLFKVLGVFFSFSEMVL